MKSPLMVYRPKEGVTPEVELSALANVYRFLLDCHAKKEAVGPRQADDLDDAGKDKDAGTYLHST